MASEIRIGFKHFVLFTSIFMSSLYVAMFVFGKVNPYFVVFHLFSLAFLAGILSRLRTCEVVVRIKPFLLISIPVIVLYVAEKVNYGSVSLVLIIGLVSGLLSFKILQSNPNTAKENKSPTHSKNLKLHIAMIFLIAALIRISFFAIPSVPMGYDVPNYLIIALEASKKSFSELLTYALSFSGDVYNDNWNFSMLWLGLSAKFLQYFGLNLLLIPKLLMPLISAVCVVPIFLLAKHLTDNEEVALYAALVFALLPSELLFCDLYKEILGEVFVILSIYFLLRFVENNKLLNAIFLIVSSFLLWKIAVTAFSKFVMFSIAALTALNKKFNAKFIISLVLLAILIPVVGAFMPITSLPLKPVKPQIDDPYTRFSFPIILLTDSTAFLLSMVVIFSRDSNKDWIKVPLSLLLSIFIYSCLLSGLLGYRIFPSSNYLNTFRYSLYISIPLAILSGKQLEKFEIKWRYVLLIFLIIDLIPATSSWTTIHSPSRFHSYLDEDEFKMLSNIDYSKYEKVVMVGNFSWAPKTKNFAVGNWIKFIVFAKTGKMPEVCNNIPEMPETLVIVYKNSNLSVVDTTDFGRVFINNQGVPSTSYSISSQIS